MLTTGIVGCGDKAESSEDPNTSDKSFTVTGMTDSYYVRIIGRKSVIKHITVAPQNEG